MQRRGTIAVLLATLMMPASLSAQRSGGRPTGGYSIGARPAPALSGGFRSFAPSRPAPAPMARGGFRSAPSEGIWGGRSGPGFRSGPGPTGFRSHRRPDGGSPWGRINYFRPWFNPWLWSSWGYPGYYFGPGYPWSSLSYPGFPEDYQSAQPEQAGAQDYGPPPDNGAGPAYDDTLANQIQELSQEVASLRQQQSQPSPQAQVGPGQEKPIATVFAYRDGHQIEARNYAIQGQTLWVFGDQITRKISLTDLDLGATKQLNDQRGVEFSLPQSP